MKKIAAVTMAYNEPDFLPIWARHYGAQVGAKHCYVVDHGSDDGSTEALGEVNIARIPRSPQDEERRARFISRFCTSLLDWYDWVIYTDVDEIALPDPRFYASFAEFCEVVVPEVVTAVGLNVQHVPAIEPPVDLARPVTEQRRWVRFSSAMCKAVLVRRAVEWAPGFHCVADAPVVFDQLYLFHLRWFDRDAGLRRLAKTRSMAWSGLVMPWQVLSDAELVAMIDAIAALPRREGVAFDTGIPPLRDLIGTLLEGAKGREHDRYKFDLTLDASELWEIPARFRGTF